MKARLLVLGLTMAGALLAQPPSGGLPPTPQEMIQRQVNRLTHFLTLTTDQQAKITGILAADINNLATLQGTLKTQREAVLAAIKANGGIPSAVSVLSSTQAQIETLRATEAASIYAILTADQKTKVGDAINILVGGGPGGPGGPGGRGPGGAGKRGFGPPR
jgi:Spy/CpxP family protein refolding chaperone